MSPGHGLKVVLGVPVTVKDDDSVGCGQVDAQPSSPGGEQEGEVSGAWGIEMLHCLHTHRQAAVELTANRQGIEGMLLLRYQQIRKTLVPNMRAGPTQTLGFVHSLEHARFALSQMPAGINTASWGLLGQESLHAN